MSQCWWALQWGGQWGAQVRPSPRVPGGQAPHRGAPPGSRRQATEGWQARVAGQGTVAGVTQVTPSPREGGGQGPQVYPRRGAGASLQDTRGWQGDGSQSSMSAVEAMMAGGGYDGGWRL